MRSPVFSIITPTFRRPLLLKRNITSVKNQTFENYEHIIVDDANDPETDHIVSTCSDDRIVLLHHGTSRGAAAGYNTGIKASRGQFILFLDDDDEYMPCFLKKMYERFSKLGYETGFVWTGIERIRSSGAGEKRLLSLTWPVHFSTKEEGLIAATSIGNGFGVCVRRECFDKIGMYDETLIVAEDTDLMFRLVQNYDFETIPEILVKIHQHDNLQLTRPENYLVRLKGKELVLKRYDNLLSKYPLLYRAHYKAYADLCYKFNLKRKGRKSIFSILRKTPFPGLILLDLFSYELTGKEFSNTSFGKILISRASTLRKIISLNR